MKRTNVLSWIFILLAAGLLAGCSRADDPTPQKEIAVTTGVTGMLKRINSIDNDTRLQGQDLKIDAYFNGTNTAYLSNTKLHYNSGWKFWTGSPGSETHYYWPIEGSVYDPSSSNITVSSLDFVGYCPYDKPTYITTGPTYIYSAGNRTITFAATMPTTTEDETLYLTDGTQNELTEFMYAIATDQTYATQVANSGVPLQFKHPFAIIKFGLSSATTTNVVVNNIMMEGLVTSGSCSFNGTASTWTSRSGSAAMKLTEDLQRDETEETSPFLVIPNNYGAKTLSVDVTWTEWGEEQNRTYTAPLTIDWVAGYAYTYTLTITKYELIVDVEKFTEQW